jgi:hypothetical protein
MSSARVCWTLPAIQNATQVDVGGLEIDDPLADSIFRAIHQPLPLLRDLPDGSTSSATEDDVVRTFTAEITSNEPLLLFITGAKGTGKSHLVRWLKSQTGSPPKWHVVYVEKRNTSLKRVIECVLEGIDTPASRELRRALEQASSEIRTEAEAMDALLMRLNHLVKYDSATELRGLSGLDEHELAHLRVQADRLLGDFTFRAALCRRGGPIERIVRLAQTGADAQPGADDEATIDEADLHLREMDLRVDPSDFEDTGQQFQRIIKSLVTNAGLRTEIAALCDTYLPRAKAEVFTGQTTDLLDVFEDVRREIASRGQELCLFIEDLVLLHGIDKQLAQALTIPANKDLCRLRAAIAVTSGYLTEVETFTDRGIHFALDIDASAIGPEGLRDFVARYLNAGRLDEETLRTTDAASEIPNACVTCPVRKQCHSTFGASALGHGLYPFNAHALDRLIALASPQKFRPRALLREVIRAPLEVAEDEIPSPGVFPSSSFAKTLDENRRSVASEVRATIRRENHDTAEAEISLRAFYAERPPDTDTELEGIARYLAVQLTPGVATGSDPGTDTEDPEPRTPQPKKPRVDEVERWVNGERLGSGLANKVRKFVCECVVAELQNGPYGLPIRKPLTREWKIGSYTLRYTDVDIDRAQGSGPLSGAATFAIGATDEDAILVRAILSAADGSGRLDTIDDGRWYFDFQRRVRVFADSIAKLAMRESGPTLDSSLVVLSILRRFSASPGNTVADALPAMFRPSLPSDVDPVIRGFAQETLGLREEALLIVRDSATAAKGSGKPSVVDIGPMYALLRDRLKLRQVDAAPEGDDDAGRLLRSLATRQSRAARQLSSDLDRLVNEVARFLQVGEDLSATLRIVDKLVEEAHRRGRLPRADSRTDYQEARAKVNPEMMTQYKKLKTILVEGFTSANIWDVLHDPRSTMTALAQYAAVTTALLGAVERLIADSPAAPGSGDASVLIREFRGLADTLDKLTEKLSN